MKEEEVNALVSRLYELDTQARDNKDEQEKIKNNLLEYMTEAHVDKISKDLFYIQRVEQVKYRIPTPAEARTIGKIAEKFISEVVDVKFRQAVSPEIAARLCPPLKTTPYVNLKLKDKEETPESASQPATA